MKQFSIYIKWLQLRFAELNVRQNRKWLLVYIVFSVAGFLGLHLIFLKKYRRFIFYLIGWIVLIGSIVATSYRAVPFQFFFFSLIFLALIFLLDFFNIYFIQTKKLQVYLPFVLMVLLFTAQIFLYEFLAQQNSVFIKEKIVEIAGHFSGMNN